MIRAVLDPGVLVAAALVPRGVCGQVLQSVLDGECAMVVCPALLVELEEVLLRPKFRRYLSVEQARQFVALVGAVSEGQLDPVVRRGLTRDPDDDYLVALAQESGADYLVSGDLDLVEIPDPHPSVLSPRVFLQRVGERGAPGPSAGA